MYDKYGWQRLATEAPSPRFRCPLIRPWHKGIPLYSTFALLLPHLWSHFGCTRLSVGMSWDFRAVPQFWKSSWQPAMIKRICNRQGNNTELFFQNWGPALNSGKNLKVTNYFRPKTLWIWPKFFPHLPHLYKIYILQKYWSKTTNPTLSSGLKKTLPRIWGHQRQLDDQDKEPMIDTKII